MEKSNTCDALYSTLLEVHARYCEDLASVDAFLIAFKRFYQVVRIERPARFVDALRYCDEFAQICAELEDDPDVFGAWRAYEGITRAVVAYDRRQEQRKTPPSLSIAELVALGVSREQIARIYGFIDEDGRADVARVDRREEWSAPELNTADNAPDAVEIARLAVKELERLADRNEDIPREQVDALASLIPPKELERVLSGEEDATNEDRPQRPGEDPETRAESIAREIWDGVPARQIAARYGLTLDEVRARADALNVNACEDAGEIPPRIITVICEARAEIESGRATFAQLARRVSTSERRYTAADVRRVLNSSK